MIKIKVDLKDNPYNIYLKDGIISEIYRYIDLNRRVLIITDKNIPSDYIERVKKQLRQPYLLTLEAGEQSKSFETFEKCHEFLLAKSFTRGDLVIALGGGVIGDLAGFVASTYKRGIDFVNIPTSTLSQIDSSVGGKTAINLAGVKNVVGSFYQPKAVFIDFSLTKSLTKRHYNSGLIEALKAGMIKDESLFKEFEKEELNVPLIITKAINIKARVVENDEREANERKILNFGHTIGHGLESYYHNSGLYHGEAVGLGILKILSNQEIYQRVKTILTKLEITSELEYDKDIVFDYILNDKKINGDKLEIIRVNKIGYAEIVELEIEQIKRYL